MAWRKRQMLGSIIKISKLIFAMFALRICANFLKYRYNYCIPDASRLKRRGAFFVNTTLSFSWHLENDNLSRRTPLNINRLQNATTSMEAL
jgi:hypothetical protein